MGGVSRNMAGEVGFLACEVECMWGVWVRAECEGSGLFNINILFTFIFVWCTALVVTGGVRWVSVDV